MNKQYIGLVVGITISIMIGFFTTQINNNGWSSFLPITFGGIALCCLAAIFKPYSALKNRKVASAAFVGTLILSGATVPETDTSYKKPKKQMPDKYGIKWYEGGTLNGVTPQEWLAANARNRLATSADLFAKMARKVKPELIDQIPDAQFNDQMKSYAQELEACITDSIQGMEAKITVNQPAAMCFTMMYAN